MHSHDNDLIAALVEGTLAEELASAAEAELAACRECSAELASQRLALEALNAIGPATMSQAESDHLRAGVAEALGIPVTSPGRAPGRSRRSPWPAIAIAAGLAGVIAIIPVMGLLTTGADDSDSAQTMAVAVAESGEDTPEPVREAASDDFEMAPTAPAGGAPATTAAAAITAAAPTVTTALPIEIAEEPSVDVLTFDGNAEIRGAFEAGPHPGSSTASGRSGLACFAEAGEQFGSDFLHIDLPANIDDGRPVILYTAADWSTLIAFDLADCAAVLTLP